MQKSVTFSVSDNHNLRDKDADDTIRLSDLEEVLENLGARLSSNEIQILTKGIKEDKQSGISYEDFVLVLLFTSFFISCFDREGEGCYSANDLKEVMTNIKMKNQPDRTEQENDKELEQIKLGIDVMIQKAEIDPLDGIDYDETIILIENNR